MGFQTMLSAELAGREAAVVEGRHAFTPRSRISRWDIQVMHTQNLPRLDEAIFQHREATIHVGSA